MNAKTTDGCRGWRLAELALGRGAMATVESDFAEQRSV
jgi:hypothetical protein